MALLRCIHLLALFSIGNVAIANNIEQSQSADGSIEFSNVGSSQNNNAHTIIYKAKTSQGLVFSDQKPQTGDYEILKFSCYACNPNSKINWYQVKLNTNAYASEVKQLAKQYGVDPALVRAVIHAESAFNPKAISRAGAQGLMQLMPATAKDLGVSNAFNATQNIEGGVKYLSQLLKQFKGDIKRATAAYNAGPNAVKKYRGIPPYQETQVYVERVGILHKRYQQES